MKPPDASLYATLGHVLRLIGEKTHSRECYEDAATQLATALRTGPDDHFFAEFELGVVQLRQGQYATAQRTFAHILTSDKDEPHAKVMLSRVNVLAAEPRAVRWWSLAIGAVAVAQAAATWAAFLLHQLTSAMVGAAFWFWP
jgi:tetratricopeptide (TPR) repeat protein